MASHFSKISLWPALDKFGTISNRTFMGLQLPTAAIAKLRAVCPKDVLSWQNGVKQREYFDQSAAQEKLCKVNKIYESL